MSLNRRVLYWLTAVGAAVCLIYLLTGTLLRAGGDSGGRFVLVGGADDASTLALFADQAITHDGDNHVIIRVLPITLASNAISITIEERNDNLALAMTRTAQIQAACITLVTPPATCDTTVVDIQVRADAFDPAHLAELGPLSVVDGVYVLDGEQAIGMQVIANTPAEDALSTLHINGVPFGGSGAGAAVQSRHMIAGYTDDNSPWGLNEGAVDLWYGPTDTISRGLRFGLASAVIESQVLARGHLARLLQAAQRKPGQHLGLGVDKETGVIIASGRIVTGTTGAYAAVVLDVETYGSADTAYYSGPNDTLSIQDVAFHILPEGTYGYNLDIRLPIVGGITDTVAPIFDGRNFDFLRPPGGYGTLLVTGDLAISPTGMVSKRFAGLAQAASGSTLVIAAGFADDTAGQASSFWANHLADLGVTGVQTAAITSTSDLSLLAMQIEEAGAIWITGDDQAIMADRVMALQTAGIADQLHDRWQAGIVLLFDNAAAAALGQWMTAEPAPTDIETYASESFIAGYVQVSPGLNWLPHAVIEPRILQDNRYGRLVNHLYKHPGVVAFGLAQDTALEIRSTAAVVHGEQAVVVLDGRYARVLEAGTNGALAATWLLLDTYVAGDVITGQIQWQAYFPFLPNTVAEIED